MSGDWNKDSEEYKFMGDFFKFSKKYYVVEPDNAEYWHEMTDESVELCEKYGNTDFVLNVVMGFMNYTSDVANKGKFVVENAEITMLADDEQISLL